MYGDSGADANNQFVESASLDEGLVTVGAEVTCVFGDARLRNAMHFSVVSVVPFILEGDSHELQKIAFPRPGVLVAKRGPAVLRGEGEALSIEFGSEGRAKIYFGKTNWEQIDRRLYPRINLAIPFKMRAVFESSEETVISVVEGQTVDMSVGGSKVQASHPVLMGSLVEFDATVNDMDKIRALGVVVYSDSDGLVGISFMDYLGATRYKLEQLTNCKAA
jgi:hypothetical protein